MSKKIIAVFGFDMETDIGSWTPYYEGVKHGTYKILEVLKKHDILSTFFFTGDCAKKFPDVVKDVASMKHEIGCHSLFHETIGDEIFEIPGVKPLLNEEIPLRLKKATEIVEKVLNDKVYSFRAPRLWGSTTMINTLEDLGYLADASYPLYFYKSQLSPYHPSEKDWTKKGDLKIVEIPNFADLSLTSNDEYGKDLDQWPLFRTKSSKELMKHITSYIEYASNIGEETVVLCFYLHPWEFVKMPEGLIHYGEGSVLPDKMITKNCGEYAVNQFDELIEMLKEIGAEFNTIKELALKY